MPAPFEDFVADRGPALLRFAYLLTGDGGLAEALVQEALIRSYRRWHGRLDAEHPEAYVRRIVVNEYVSWRRRSSGELPGRIPDQPTSDPADGLAERDLVWRALATIPRRQRAIMVLRYYESLSDRDIAVVLGCAEGTVRSLAARAFTSLRRDPQLSAEPGPTSVRREESS